MKRFLLLLICIPSICVAQQLTYKQETRLITEHWSFDPKEAKPDLQFSLEHVEAPVPGGELDEKNRAALKNLVSEKYPKRNLPEKGQRSSEDSLMVLDGFPATFWYNGAELIGGRPNDNTLAISDSGMLLTSYNTQLWGYDIVADTYLFNGFARHPSFAQFLNEYSDTNISTSFPFDPKLLYDPVRDRFIFMFLTGRDPDESGAIVAFSSTNYPSDVWHAYFLSGNPVNDNTWTDYPQIAINEHDLFLTLNQLYPDSSWITGFAQTVVWQMDLDAGFAGADSLPVNLYTDIAYEGKNIRYLHPAKNGLGPEGDEMHFIVNRPFDLENDTFFLVTLKGAQSAPTQTLDVKVATSSTPYVYPANAEQPGGDPFTTNDARALGAVRIGNEIQFVGNCTDPTTGHAAVYHGTIEDVTASNLNITAEIIADGTLEFGYPNIDFVGYTEQDRDVVVFFNHASATDFAGNSAVYVNNDRAYGPIQRLVDGTARVERMGGPTERWGDYSGIQRKFNCDKEVWVAGYYSFGNTSNGIWVSQLQGPGWPTSVERAELESKKIALFPNPSSDWVKVQFEMPERRKARITLHDMSGRTIQVLGEDYVKAGVNQIQLNLLPLAQGVYSLRVVSGDLIIEEKLIKH